MIGVSSGRATPGTVPVFAAVANRDRPQIMRSDLERFFNPRAIAIIGASQDFGTISGPFQVTGLEYAGEHDGEVAYEIALESAGPVSFAAAP